MTVYWTNIEFDIINPSEYEDCVGGFVYLFVNAFDVQDALPKFVQAIAEEDLKIIQIEFISPYDDTPWDLEEDQVLYDALAKEAQDSDMVIWDQISAYESKDE
ncbi:MAG: hypothetical protein ABIJ31_11645 [Pseudomonadota bacterium]